MKAEPGSVVTGAAAQSALPWLGRSTSTKQAPVPFSNGWPINHPECHRGTTCSLSQAAGASHSTETTASIGRCPSPNYLIPVTNSQVLLILTAGLWWFYVPGRPWHLLLNYPISKPFQCSCKIRTIINFIVEMNKLRYGIVSQHHSPPTIGIR